MLLLLSFNICIYIENLTYLDKLCAKYVSPFRIWIGPKLFVFVHDVNDIETVLKSPNCLNKMYVYKFVKDGLGDVDGMFTAEGIKIVKFFA